MIEITAPSKDIPHNLYKQNNPLQVTVLKNQRLTGPNSANDVRHLQFELTDPGFQYIEGQSIGVLAPGEDAQGKPHKLRLYSIASPSVGDDGDGKTLSLCVKRANTTDPETGTIYKGVCSNFLCDLAPGQTLPITGPVGKTFLLPETDNINLIMIATGTGIAPFRGFLHQRFKQNRTQQGENWLFFGAQVQDDFLYEAELKTYEAKHGLHLVTAFSREETNDQGGRMYVQHRIQAHANQMIQLLKQPNTYVYICGLRGMESGINEGLLQAAQYQGTDWDSLLLQLKTEKRWHLEVY